MTMSCWKPSPPPVAPGQTCTVTLGSGRFCDRKVPGDAPISVCHRHLASAYLYMENLIAAANTERDHGVSPAELKRDNQLNPPSSLVYYLRFGDRVKIGTTSQRLQDRVTNLPHDKILGWEPGGRDVERQRHDQFRLCRIKGEWFAATDELVRHAECCGRRHGVLQ